MSTAHATVNDNISKLVRTLEPEVDQEEMVITGIVGCLVIVYGIVFSSIAIVFVLVLVLVLVHV